MSTPKSKPSTKPIKASEPKPKYNIGQKVFIIDDERRRGGEVMQGKVLRLITEKVPTQNDSGTIIGSSHVFSYTLMTSCGTYFDVAEYRIYPTITAVALEFIPRVSHMLK